MSEQPKPLSLIYNKKSGFHAANKDEVYEQLVADLSTAGFEIQSFELSECMNFDQMMQEYFTTPSSSGECRGRGCCRW